MDRADTLETQLPGYAKRWLGLLFIGLSVIVISLDNTVLNAALPSISRQLGATTNELQWIVDGYVLVFAALLLTTGSLGDRFGRKKALQFGLGWFAVASFAAALSTSTGMLIATRAILAIGSALILPATLSIVTATFPPRERPQAIAIWAAIFGFGVGLGPVIGGFLLEHFEWNAVFLINLPSCAIALVGGALTLVDSKDEHPPAIDIPGVILSILGLFALIYGFIEAGVRGWTDTTVLLALGIGIVVLAAFAWWEAHSPNAMLPLRFFKNLSFSVASIAMAMITFTQFSILFFLSPYLQTVQGYSTLQAGLRLLPMALTLTAMATISARIAARLGTKHTVALGIIIASGALLFMALIFRVDTPFGPLMLAQIVLGIGVGMAFSPATNSIMGAVPIDKAGVGSAMNDTTRQIGGALSIALLGSILNLSYIGSVSILKGQVPADVFSAILNSVQAAHLTAAKLPAALSQLVITTADQAYLTGMSHALLISAIILVVTAGFVLVFLPAQVRRYGESASRVGAQVVGASVGD